jgi:Caspase domain
MKSRLISLICLFTSTFAFGQSFQAKTNTIVLDYSSKDLIYNSTLPTITWISPENETVFMKEGRTQLKFTVDCKTPIKSIKLSLSEKETSEASKSVTIPIPEESKLHVNVEKTIFLNDGVSVLTVIVENRDGIETISKRELHVGNTALADASKLGRKDYALIFSTDNYDSWKTLANPIYDGRTIANNLQKIYGFNTEVVENATQSQVLDKLREYAEKKYGELDQLLIFFAGHGFYDETFKEGFVVTRESLPDDPGRNSYLRHSVLRSTINNNPCQHVFLVMDVCFGGSFDESLAARSIEDNTYAPSSQSEIIIRKLKFKTRKYLTSGGKEYVSDGIPGRHSPFAKQLIEALEKGMGNDGILTLNELMTYVETLKIAPQYGKFGTDQLGSDFVFVIK